MVPAAPADRHIIFMPTLTPAKIKRLTEVKAELRIFQMTPYKTPQSTNCRTTNRRFLTRLPAGIRRYQIFRWEVDSHPRLPFFTVVPDESDVCAVVLGISFVDVKYGFRGEMTP